MCNGRLLLQKENEYFSFFVCKICHRHFCLAYDNRGTWSILKHPSFKSQHWCECTKQMHKLKDNDGVKVIFT